MPYTPAHFSRGPLRPTDDLFKTVDPVKPEPLEQIPVPEATESDWAAFDEVRGKQ